MFYQKINKRSNKEMYEFIMRHFTYDTMNSWNAMESIANNVKIYNLGLENEIEEKFFEFTYNESIWVREYFYSGLNDLIEDFEIENPSYSVGFNGRSGGYLVLYNKNNYCNIITNIEKYDSYEDWKRDIKENGELVSDYTSLLKEYTELIQNFDRLCDNMREYLIYICKNAIIEEEEETTIVMKKL